MSRCVPCATTSGVHVEYSLDPLDCAVLLWFFGGLLTAAGQQPGVLHDAQTDARSSVAIQEFFKELFDE
jgi:hypothetical protein